MSRIRETKAQLLDRIAQLEADQAERSRATHEAVNRVVSSLLAVAQVAEAARAQAEGLARCPEAQGAVALVLKEIAYRLSCIELTLRRTAR